MSTEISQETGRESFWPEYRISPISCMLLQVSIGSGLSNKYLQTSLYLCRSV